MAENDFWNEEAEESILGIMLVDNNRIQQIISILNEDDIFDKANKLIFKAIKDMTKEDKPVDIVTVSEYLRFNNELEEVGDREYINTLAENVITTANWKNYCKIIVKYSKKRQLINLAKKITEETASDDVEDIAMEAKQELENILVNRTSNNISHIFNGLDTVISQVESILSSDSRLLGVSTGLYSLDYILSGLVGGRLYILGARPSMGKSSLAQQIAETVASNKDKNVVFASLEMGLDEYTQRSLFRRVNITQEMLSRGLVNDTIYDKIAKQSEYLSKLNLYILDNADCTLNDLETGIINCINSKGTCDLVIVDYLQLMASDDKRERDPLKVVSRNSSGLKKLARKYNVPILALCQLSRSLETRMDKRPILSDLRESGTIEQDADVVMFIYRDEVYNKDDPTNRGMAELLISKNRQGRTGIIDLVFEANKTLFKEIKNR